MARQETDDWQRYLLSLGKAVEHIQRFTADGAAEGPEVYSLLCKLEADNRTSVLVVVKAHGPDRELVGFCGGRTLGEALLALSKKLIAGAVRWREDRPWEER